MIKRITWYLIAISCIMFLFTMTTASADTYTSLVEMNLLYSTEDCSGWRAGEIGELPPGHVALGDVFVNGKQHFDNGSGEQTIVINLTNVTNKSVMIQADYGAGEKVILDVAEMDLQVLKFQLALESFCVREEAKDGTPKYSFDSVRFVIINSNGNVTTTPANDEIITRTEFFSGYFTD
jgi:hypothetical protein